VKAGGVQHLASAGQEREDSAVERFLHLAGIVQLRPQWFSSLGVDPVRHWALLRPKLNGVHPKVAEVEVDIILGNLAAHAWPPSLEFLVGVEAKAWKVEWRDMARRGRRPHAGTDLWKQVGRNIKCGFERVAGLDLICPQPGRDYWDAILVSNAARESQEGWLADRAAEAVNLGAGHAIFAFGPVPHKDEAHSGTLLTCMCSDASPLGKHRAVLEDAVRAKLNACPEPRMRPPYHFTERNGRWEILLAAS
jgi:hypothetical protein